MSIGLEMLGVGEVGDRPVGGDAPDRAVAGVREPQRAVGTGGDAERRDDGAVAVELEVTVGR